MKINPKYDIKLLSFPLPIYTSIKIAEAISKDGETFSIFAGLDKEKLEQLKKLSLDKNDLEIQQNTSDLKRFGEGSYENWYRKNRTPFALIHKNTNALAALIWFGPEPLAEKKDNYYTVAWRSYPLFRGKGLMKEFTKFVMDILSESIPKIKFWITTKKENIGSIRLAKFFGFQELENTSSGNNSIIMIK